MRKSRFTERQIVVVLKQAEAGVPVQDLIRKYGISEQTSYRWRKQYGGLGARRLEGQSQADSPPLLRGRPSGTDHLDRESLTALGPASGAASRCQRCLHYHRNWYRPRGRVTGLYRSGNGRSDRVGRGRRHGWRFFGGSTKSRPHPASRGLIGAIKNE